MLRISPFGQFIAGVAAALTFCSVLLWTPIPHELLIALAVAGILKLLVADHHAQSAGDHGFFFLRLARRLISYPYFSLGVAIVMTVALFLSYRPR
jgi:hypothetical protein